MKIFALLCAFASGVLFGCAFRLLPEPWLCDYGETPRACHAPQCRRLPVWQLLLFGTLCTVCTAGAMAQLQGTFSLFLFAMLVGVLLLAALCDARYTILPDELLLLGSVLALLLYFGGALQNMQPMWYMPLLGALLGFFGLWGVLWLASKIYHTDAIGFGDVKLLALLGFLCGPAGLGVAVLLAVLSAALVCVPLLLLKKIKRTDAFPFGPFLVGGALCALCAWQPWHNLLTWYFGLFSSI
ncbi:MAG: A24 family peptidase [Ruthenibacterium sp.]